MLFFKYEYFSPRLSNSKRKSQTFDSECKIHMIFEYTYFLWVKLSIGSDDYVNVDIFAYFKIIKRTWLKQKRGVTLLVPLQWFIHSWIYVWKDSLALFTCINILTALLHKQCSIKIMVPCTKIEKSVFTIAYWQLNHLKLYKQCVVINNPDL